MSDESTRDRPPDPEEEIFAACLARPLEERTKYLDQVCAGDAALRQRVEELLRSHKLTESFLEEPPVSLGTGQTIPLDMPLAEKVGDHIGRYKLLQQIGEGGCGLVYMAEQEEPVKRHVALKVIKLGMDTKSVIARFGAERQALALMDHPNIAKVLDAGATDKGQPYFVMELVPGVKITDYCDKNALSTRERLLLFVQVCQAIQHAHQKGIIHRDIKPSNILVTLRDGVPVPKVIDFGIAKATQGKLTDQTLFTAFEQFIGTPAYMSPEQAEMSALDIDTRSDLYSLGVLLYELLTGKTPFDATKLLQAGIDEMRRQIREKEPARPSTRLSSMLAADLTQVAAHRRSAPPKLIHLVRGDLDWIVMKCLEKDRTRRYESANGLAADLKRHLENEPVVARPPSATYKFQKAFRRHKLVFSAAAAILVALAAGLGLAALGWRQTSVERDKAQQAKTEETLQRKAAASERAKAEAARAQAQDLLHKAAEDDRAAADEAFGTDKELVAFAHLARACEYDPTSTFAPEMAVVALNFWKHLLPAAILSAPEGISAAEFSPDGLRIVTFLGDKTARMWDANTGKPLPSPSGFEGKLNSTQFNWDGARLVTASADGTARVWDTRNWNLLTTLSADQLEVAAAEFSPDGSRIVTTSFDNLARVWDAGSGKLLATLSAQTNRVLRALFSPDGSRILTCSLNEPDRVWNVTSGRLVTTFLWGANDQLDQGFSPDGTRIISVSATNTIRLWNAGSGEQLAELSGHQGEVYHARFSPDGKRIVSASADKTARIWDVSTGKQLATLSGHGGIVDDAQFSPDGSRIVTASYDHTACVWDAQTGERLATLGGHHGVVDSARFSPDGSRILTTSFDHSAEVWDVGQVKNPGATFTGEDSAANSALFSPDYSRLLDVSTNHICRVWDTGDGRMLTTLRGSGGCFFDRPNQAGRLGSYSENAQFSPDGTRVIFTQTNETAGLWNGLTGEFLATLAGGTGRFYGAVFSRDGSRIAAASNKEAARIWDARNGGLLATLTGGDGGFYGAEFSPDGAMIIAASTNQTARVWNAHDGKLLATLPTGSAVDSEPQGHFSPDGKRILTFPGFAKPAQPARVWEARSGQLLTTLSGTASSGLRAQFSPDGTHILAGLGGQTLRIWDASSGRLITTFSNVWSTDYSPDGSRIATEPLQGTARVWDANSGELLNSLWWHNKLVGNPVFSPDGRLIATAAVLENAAQLWDTRSGKLVATLPFGFIDQTSAAGVRGNTELIGPRFSNDGLSLFLAKKNFPGQRIDMQHFEILPARAGAPPPWFPDFLRYMAQAQLKSDSELETITLEEWLVLRERLRKVLRATPATDNPYLRILSQYVHQ